MGTILVVTSVFETKFRYKISKLSFDNLLEEKGVLEQNFSNFYVCSEINSLEI